MPSSIPYNHPSLVIGNIADTRVLGLLKQIDSCQAKIDAAQEKLGSLIMLKRSMAMTMNELADMSIDVSALMQKQQELDTSINSAAASYMSSRIDNESQIQQLREQLSELEIQESMESPVDFTASQLKTLPLASESIKLDSQYFAFGSNMQDDALANAERFVRSATSNLGEKSGDITNAVSSQITNQLQNHSLAGTLIIAASCTHNDVKLFEPLVIDPDKAVAAWNVVNGKESFIDTQLLASVSAVPQDNAQSEGQNDLTLITGAAYGSSFVGMVHILNSESSASGNIDQLKEKLDSRLKVGGWINNASGGLGIDDAVLKEVKALLSTQSVSCHVSAVVMGALPSMSSGKLEGGIRTLGSMVGGQQELIAAGMDDDITTVSSDAEKARAAARIISAQNMKMKAMMNSLGDIDRLSNSTLDINSLMSAFDNYLKMISSENRKAGVPINFYFKKLTKPFIERLWLNKYYPPQPAKPAAAKQDKAS